MSFIGLGNIVLYSAGMSLTGTGLSIAGVFGGYAVYDKIKGGNNSGSSSQIGPNFGGMFTLAGSMLGAEVIATTLILKMFRLPFAPQLLIYIIPMKLLQYYVAKKAIFG
jgi:hypothetical protein